MIVYNYVYCMSILLSASFNPDWNAIEAQEKISVVINDRVDNTQGELGEILRWSQEIYQLTERDTAEIAKNLEKNEKVNDRVTIVSPFTWAKEHIIDWKIYTVEIIDTSKNWPWDRPYIVLSDPETWIQKRITRVYPDITLEWIPYLAKWYMTSLKNEWMEVCWFKEIRIEKDKVVFLVNYEFRKSWIKSWPLEFPLETFNELFANEVIQWNQNHLKLEMEEFRSDNLEKIIGEKISEYVWDWIKDKIMKIVKDNTKWVTIIYQDHAPINE